jgi:hypothetical protein
MDTISNATADLAASSDKFITSVYKEIARKTFRSHLIKADLYDDFKGIDYYLFNYSVQFKELKSGPDRGCYDSNIFPFETEAKNRFGKFQNGWIYHTEADLLIFIRTIRSTGEWKASVYNWKELQPYILANVERSWINRFGSAKNKNFLKEELKKYLVAEIN